MPKTTIGLIQTVMRHGLVMRNEFNFKRHSVAHWFPGHMGKGINTVHRKLKNVDCVIEVHDARIPISGRNPTFERDLSQVKPHVLVLNKMDFISHASRNKIHNYYQEHLNKEVIFTNCRNPKNEGIIHLVPFVRDIIKKSERYSRSINIDCSIMIIGIPNVGKSSLINALRIKNLGRGKATQVGALPGLTRSVLERIKIAEDPPLYVLDTPGILPPRIENVEVGLKLALVNTIKEHLVGEDIIADFLLYRMNLEGNHKYVEALNLDEPTDDIQKCLVVSAIRSNMTLKLRRYVAQGGLDVVPDTLRAAKKFLSLYRSNEFGPLKLDLMEKNGF